MTKKDYQLLARALKEANRAGISHFNDLLPDYTEEEVLNEHRYLIKSVYE